MLFNPFDTINDYSTPIQSMFWETLKSNKNMTFHQRRTLMRRLSSLKKITTNDDIYYYINLPWYSWWDTNSGKAINGRSRFLILKSKIPKLCTVSTTFKGCRLCNFHSMASDYLNLSCLRRIITLVAGSLCPKRDSLSSWPLCFWTV